MCLISCWWLLSLFDGGGMEGTWNRQVELLTQDYSASDRHGLCLNVGSLTSEPMPFRTLPHFHFIMAALREGVRAFYLYCTVGYMEAQRLLVDVVRLTVIARSKAEALSWAFRAWVKSFHGNILPSELSLLLSPLRPCSAPSSNGGVAEGWHVRANRARLWATHCTWVSHLIVTTLWSLYCYYSHFTGGKSDSKSDFSQGHTARKWGAKV